MWELIQANKRKSVVLVAVLAIILIGMGYAIGFIIAPDVREAPIFGVLIATLIWVFMTTTSLVGGEKILLATAGAREVAKKDAPQLYNVVEEMSIASGLPVPPRIFIIDSPEPNAFAVGLKPERAAVAITTGLLGKLSRDELQAVMAHEIAHIHNRDTLFMTLIGVTVGAVVILAELLLRGMIFGRGPRARGGGGRGGGQGAAVIYLVAIVFALLAPILAYILYFACSRRREYLADACAAQYTRYPEGLASALEKISRHVARGPSKKTASKTLAPMYIVNPLAAHGRRAGLFSTHPPTEDRVRVLRGMTNASLAAYEEAYRSTHKGEKGVFVSAALRGIEPQEIRTPAAEEPANQTRQWREVRDLLHKVDQYALLACACGMKIKIPPDFEDPRVHCPKCGREHEGAPGLFASLGALGHAQEKNS